MLSKLNMYCHGYVAIPVIDACRKHGLFTILQPTKPTSFSTIVKKLKPNPGYLRIALHMLESLGWVSKNSKQAYILTSETESQEIPDKILELYRIPLEELLVQREQQNQLSRWIQELIVVWSVSPLRTHRLLEGSLLLPLLMSIRHGGYLEQKPIFKTLNKDLQSTLRIMFVHKKWCIEEKGKINLTALGTKLIGQLNVMAIAASYRPILAQIHELLFGNPAQVFQEAPNSKMSYVSRSMHSLASELQHKQELKDIEEQIISIFNKFPVKKQPKYIAHMGCGDGSFLERLYSAIRKRSKRGEVLQKSPLTLIGIDDKQTTLLEAEKSLADLPHITLLGDINDPEQLVSDLKAKGIYDTENILHVRYFLDCDFRYSTSKQASQISKELPITPEGNYVDYRGKSIFPKQIVKAWWNHLARWSRIINTHGLLLLQSHCSPTHVAYSYFEKAESLYYDTLHALSRRYLTDAEFFLVLAANVGLFTKQQPVRYPAALPFCRITISHLEKRDYTIRNADISDLNVLTHLEEGCWTPALQTSGADIVSRLTDYPQGQFVLEFNNQVVGVIYSQRIECKAVLQGVSGKKVFKLHKADGPIAQLLAINILPEMQHKNFDTQLLEFMLQRCSLTNGVESVVAVTRCKEYNIKSNLPLEDYIHTCNEQGRLVDPILRFHHQHGAKIEDIIPNYRSGDTQNKGCGVLVSYAIHNRTRDEVQSEKNLPQRTSCVPTPQSRFSTEKECLKNLLSDGQKGLWVLQKTYPEMSTYNIPLCFRIFKNLDVEIFRQACCVLLKQYPILTSSFKEDDGVLYQIMDPLASLVIEDEMQEVPSEFQKLLFILNQKAKKPFILEEGPLLRVHLFSISENKSIVLIVIHHIIFDVHSSPLLIKTLLDTYQALSQGKEAILTPPPARYQDFVVEQQKILEKEEHLSYWQQQLSGTLPTLDLPTDHPRFSSQSYQGKTHTSLLSAEESKRVKRFSKDKSIDLSTFFLCIFKGLLHQYTGQENLIVGISVDERRKKQFDKLIGFFINMVPVRSYCIENQSFLHFSKTVQATLANGFSHSYPFSALVRHFNISDVENTPIFQAAFEYQEFLSSANLRRLQSDFSLPIEFIEEIHQEGEYELELEVQEQKHEFVLNLKYNSGLFDDSTIARMIGHYMKLLREVTANPNLCLGEVPLLSEEEEKKLLFGWNDTEIMYPEKQCVHMLFESQAQTTPKAIAAVFENELLTYEELNKKSTILAKFLQKSGIRPDKLVAICVERSLEMLVGLIGILKAGAAYVPLDPEYPEERLAYMLEDSQASIVLTESALMDKVSELIGQAKPTDQGKQVHCIALDTEWNEIIKEAEGRKRLQRKVKPHHLAYVIYTSGSTGKPKGVMVPHQALTNFLISMGNQPGLQANDKLLAVTTYCFDIAGLELYLPLIKGAICHICHAEKLKDAEKLKNEIKRVKPTIMQATPATWTMLFNANWTNEEKIKILCGGEELPKSLSHHFINTDTEAWNLYGPTETTIWSTVHRITEAETITIGKPIANTQVYIVDNKLHLKPIGIAGELCIAGAGLTKGYLNRPELTEKKFVDNPFCSDAKLYKTGDLARWLGDGTIEFMGRIDRQVKIRGFRIELGEIETQLNHHQMIKESVVLAKEQEGSKQLIAYYVSKKQINKSERIDSQELGNYLRSILPEYMIPAFFIQLDKMPLTSNGKFDRLALTEREVVITRTEKICQPQSEVEDKVLAIWKGVLHVEDIGTEDRFFDVGGNSLLAVTVAEKIKKDLDRDFNVTKLFKYTDIKKISNYITSTSLQSTSRHVLKIQSSSVGSAVNAYRQKRALSSVDEKRNQDHNPLDSNNAPQKDLHSDMDDSPIVIVGMAGKFPMANDLHAFWNNLIEGKNCITEIPRDRWDWKAIYGNPAKETNKTQIKWGGFIEGVQKFDPLFFDISPREAELMDPQQRLLMTYAWLAMEDAGIPPLTFSQQATGVFVATAPGEYHNFLSTTPEDNPYRITSAMTSMIPNRISYALDLCGPSEYCETACSSSLVALHRAIQALHRQECSQAIVGAVNLLLCPKKFIGYESMGLLSQENHVKSFQAKANGYIRSEGIGVIILKHLQQAVKDKDIIYALIKGTGVFHGGKGMSLTAPNSTGIKRAMIQAYRASGIDPQTVSYIEAHGTASPLGDSIEIEALESGYHELVEAYPHKKRTKHPCHLSSLKPCIGHGEIVSGMGALIKVVSAIRHRVIPGIPRFTTLHEHVSLDQSPFTIKAENQPWKPLKGTEGNLPRRASINSYGFGVNAHMVLEEYIPLQEEPLPTFTTPSPQIVIFSAKDSNRLQSIVRNMQLFLEGHPKISLPDLAYTLQIGRGAMNKRLAIIASSLDELSQWLMNYSSLSTASRQKPIFIGTIKDGVNEKKKNEALMKAAFEKRHLEKIASLWVKGIDVSWEELHHGQPVRRISLPIFPFIEKAYWLQNSSNLKKTNASQQKQVAIQKGNMKKKRICVVGAGPSGLVMAKSLLEEGHQPIIYDAQDALGGVWNLKAHKSVGAYKKTRFQNSKDTSFFSDFYPTTGKGIFLGVEEVREYLAQYAQKFDLSSSIHYHSKILSVHEEGKQWTVRIQQEGRQFSDIFDGIALCHGRYRVPFRPSIEGLDQFQGEVIHSGQYYDNKIFTGKRVLVIGNGVSGMDIAEEATQTAAEVFWSMRSLRFVLPRMVGFLPNDFVSPSNLMMSEYTRSIRNIEQLKDSMPEYYALFQKSGLFPSLQEFRQHPFVLVNDGAIKQVAEGKIQTIVGEVERFVDNGCIFSGSRKTIDELDMVVLCTGYKPLSVFDYVEGISPQQDFAMGLFHHENPSMVNPYGLQEIGTIGSFPFLEMVARWYAQIMSGNYQLSQEELEHRVDVHDIVLAPISSLIFGLKLGLVPKPEKEFKEFWKILNIPCFPMIYRMRGPHADPKAQASLARCLQRSLIQNDKQDPELEKIKYRLLAGLDDEALQDLLSREEITENDYQNAQSHRHDPIILNWNSQYMKVKRKHSEERTKATDEKITSLHPLKDAQYKELFSQVKQKKLDAYGLINELRLMEIT